MVAICKALEVLACLGVCKSVQVNQTLRDLCLGNNNLGDTGFAVICELLKVIEIVPWRRQPQQVNCTLTSLGLAFNQQEQLLSATC